MQTTLSFPKQKVINKHQNNNSIRKYIEKINTGTKLSIESKNHIKEYSGSGGLWQQGATGQGILSEYYTPKEIVDFAWNLARKHLQSKNKYRVLEPSCGKGNFFEEVKDSKDLEIHGIEISEHSSKIAQILYPDIKIENKAFQDLFIKNNAPSKYEGDKYDLIIGNPPFGSYQGIYKGMGEGKAIKYYSDYFIYRSLDLLNENGILVFVVPSSFLRSKEYKTKNEISAKSHLLEAHRLPEGTFERTKIGTDLIVLTKTNNNDLDNKELFFNDTYFSKHRENIQGQEIERTNRFGRVEKAVIKDISKTNAIKESKQKEASYIVPWQRLECGVWGYREGDISKSYSGDTLANNWIRTPFKFNGKQYVTTGTGGTTEGQVRAYELLEDKGQTFNEEEYSYIGRKITYKGKDYVLANQTTFIASEKTVEEHVQHWKQINKHAGYFMHHANGQRKSYEEYLQEIIPKTENETKAITFEIDRINNSSSEKQSDQIINSDKFSDIDKKIWASIGVDGSVCGFNIESYPDELNCYKGKKYNNFNYFQGNIRSKLKQLENDKAFISEPQYNKQKNGLEKLLPKYKTIDQISLVPASVFCRSIDFGGKFDGRYGTEQDNTLINRFSTWLEETTALEREGLTIYDLDRYIRGDRVCGGSKEENRKIKEKRKSICDKLFNQFIQQGLTSEEQSQITDEFNKTYNSWHYPNYIDVPLYLADISKTFNGNALKIKDTQIEGASFLTNKGVGLLAFEVGVGKTMTGILAVIQTMQKGWCKKPLVLVPKQVYTNWIKEFSELFPNIKLNELNNMSDCSYNIAENTVTIATHQALDNLFYKEETEEELLQDVFDQMKRNGDLNKRDRAKEAQKAETILGTAKKKTKLFIEDIGFDLLLVDEAHRFKNLFSQAKSESIDKVNEFSTITGSSSARSAKLFLLSQYILRNNRNRNVYLLTATPFNNSPLEIYNMLSYIARYRLKEMGLLNVNDFMETFIDAKYEWVIKPKGIPEKSQVVKGFINAGILREVVNEFILFRTAKDAKVLRPEKTVKVVKINLSPEQKEKMLFYEDMAYKNINAGDTLKAIGKMRLLTLSPDISDGRINITAQEFVERSPKLLFTAQAIKSVLEASPKTCQLVYMPQGKDWIPLFKSYLVEEQGITPNKIEIITSGISDTKVDNIIDKFNRGEVQVLIGTSKISEGLNLNRKTSLLYNLYLGWNPTEQMQIEGRVHRQGNENKKIRVIYPIMRNSSDSVMFQKLGEKTARINFLWDSNEDYISTEEINPEELKLDIITDPAKKAKFKIIMREEEIDYEIGYLKARIEGLESKFERRIQLETQKKEYEAAHAGKHSYSYGNYQIDYAKKIKSTVSKIERFDLALKKQEIVYSEIPELVKKLESKIIEFEEEKEGLSSDEEKYLVQYKKEAQAQKGNEQNMDDLLNDMCLENKLFFELPKKDNITANKEEIRNNKIVELSFQPMLFAV
jgi:hypothetical protein